MQKLLTLFALVLSLSSWAQSDEYDPFMNREKKKVDERPLISQPLSLSAGEYLEKSGKLGTSALIFQLVGGGIGCGLVFLVEDTPEIGYCVIGATQIIGLVMHFMSYDNLTKAGRVMKEKNIGLIINENSIGLSISLSL